MSARKISASCETLRHVAKRLAAEAVSHRDSLRAALPVIGEPAEIDVDYVLALTISLTEKVTELRGVRKKIDILNRELGD